MSERQIEEAIDAAVRDLMNVDADPAFRARVVERLRKPASHSAVWRQVSVAAVAIAIAVTGAALIRNGKGSAVEERHSPAAVAAPPPAPAIEPRTSERPVPVPSRLPIRTGPRPNANNPTHEVSRGALSATVADAVAADPAPESVEPLNTIRPIEVSPIEQTPIVTAEIAIAPLAPLSGLVIAPLDPRRERD
jgi:hypothetical protein